MVDDPARDPESVPVSQADVDSAGRSCMAIIVLVVLILLIIGGWIAVRTLGVGQ